MRNTGDRAGKAVVQVYIGHPPEAQSPPWEHKRFAVVRLPAGGSTRETVTIALDDLMVYDGQQQARSLVPGSHRVAVGLSSRDLRLYGGLQLVVDSGHEGNT